MLTQADCNPLRSHPFPSTLIEKNSPPYCYSCLVFFYGAEQVAWKESEEGRKWLGRVPCHKCLMGVWVCRVVVQLRGLVSAVPQIADNLAITLIRGSTRLLSKMQSYLAVVDVGGRGWMRRLSHRGHPSPLNSQLPRLNGVFPFLSRLRVCILPAEFHIWGQILKLKVKPNQQQ